MDVSPQLFLTNAAAAPRLESILRPAVLEDVAPVLIIGIVIGYMVRSLTAY